MPSTAAAVLAAMKTLSAAEPPRTAAAGTVRKTCAMHGFRPFAALAAFQAARAGLPHSAPAARAWERAIINAAGAAR